VSARRVLLSDGPYTAKGWECSMSRDQNRARPTGENQRVYGRDALPGVPFSQLTLPPPFGMRCLVRLSCPPLPAPPPTLRKDSLSKALFFPRDTARQRSPNSKVPMLFAFPPQATRSFQPSSPFWGPAFLHPPPHFHRSHPHSHAHSVSGHFDGVPCFEGSGCHFKPVTEEKYLKGNLPGGEITRGFSGFIPKKD